MTSEWMKVMLEEIERKLKDAEQAQIECARREGKSRRRRGTSSLWRSCTERAGAPIAKPRCAA